MPSFVRGDNLEYLAAAEGVTRWNRGPGGFGMADDEHYDVVISGTGAAKGMPIGATMHVVDARFFPSIGAVNRSLTAIPNAPRVGDHITERAR
jgi:hypothetical protein